MYTHALVIDIETVQGNIRLCSSQLLGISTWKECGFPEKVQDKLGPGVVLKYPP